MTDLAIDPLTRDVIYEDGDVRVTGRRGDIASERAEILQRLLQRLQTQRGEWSFDVEIGVNYLGLIFGDDIDDDAIIAHLTEVASRGYRIRRVLSLEVRRLGRQVFAAGEVDTELGRMTFDTGDLSA